MNEWNKSGWILRTNTGTASQSLKLKVIQKSKNPYIFIYIARYPKQLKTSFKFREDPLWGLLQWNAKDQLTNKNNLRLN